MADRVLARDEKNLGPRINPEEGQQQGVLVDVIDLGMKKDQYLNEEPRLVHKIALVFQTSEVHPKTGKRFTVHKEYTNSMGKKANLRADLTAWRGKPFTDDEARRGVDLAAMVGANALLSLALKEPRTGGDPYPIIVSIAGLPKQIPSIAPQEYTRADWWQERKDEYARGAKDMLFAAQAAQLAAALADDAFPPPIEDEDDDLPF
jgi:hypothetical protein